MEIKGYITNLADYNAGRLNSEWLTFPADEEEIDAALERIGCADGTEYFFSDWESDTLRPCDLGEYITPEEVNDIYENLEAWDEDALNAALEVFGLDDILNSSPDDYFFAPGIDTDEDLGYYYADACGIFYGNTRDTLERYFDYEAYGRDIRLETDGDFTAYGWIERL